MGPTHNVQPTYNALIRDTAFDHQLAFHALLTCREASVWLSCDSYPGSFQVVFPDAQHPLNPESAVHCTPTFLTYPQPWQIIFAGLSTSNKVD